ncbi:CGNR zinc finger domain-containing protein [Bradyrhizobium canariense]
MDYSVVRACEGPGCGICLLGKMSERPRRWCGVAVCGR